VLVLQRGHVTVGWTRAVVAVGRFPEVPGALHGADRGHPRGLLMESSTTPSGSVVVSGSLHRTRGWPWVL